MKALIIGALLISSAHTATVKIEARTDDGFGAWFIPTRINSVVVNKIGTTTCTSTVEGSGFQLICEIKSGKVLIYQDQTPQKDAIIATPNIVVNITTLGK